MTEFWYELAERLGMTPSQVKSATLSSEVPLWMAKFEKEWNQRRKQDYFLAQIAYWLYLNWFVHTNNPKNPKTPDRTLESFLVDFKIGPKGLTTDEEYRMLSEEEKLERVKKSKRAWFSAMGLNSKGKPKANVQYKTKKAPKPGSAYVKPHKKEAVTNGS